MNHNRQRHYHQQSNAVRRLAATTKLLPQASKKKRFALLDL